MVEQCAMHKDAGSNPTQAMLVLLGPLNMNVLCTKMRLIYFSNNILMYERVYVCEMIWNWCSYVMSWFARAINYALLCNTYAPDDL